MNRRVVWSGLALLMAAGVLFALAQWRRGPTPAPAASEASLRLAGSASCASCHPRQYEGWLESNHRHAMEPPTDASVRGDFGGVELDYFGRTTRFSREGDAFLVTTEGARGERETFPVAYTLGYHPLQQYLVDVGGGRLQALPFAWDTRPAGEGGERWFHLYPDDDIAPGDPLFWTRPAHNVNHMCAECHTTGFAKRYDRSTDVFRSTWSETGAGCESCHGAGAAHVEARQLAPSGAAPASAGAPASARLRSLSTLDTQIDQCGFCHARRVRLRDTTPDAQLHETMLETWRPDLPTEGLYFADGQIQDEVFEIGSFLQSRMAAEGVRCSDCHDPHSSRLREEGNALCTRCHDAETFDARTHTLHAADTTASQCVTCHMPVRTYMVVDDRHDHRLSVPRPEVSEAVGSPDPCVTCHTGRTHSWAATAIARARAATGTDREAGSDREDAPSLGIVARALAREQDGAADLLRRFLDHPATAPIAKAAALATSRPLSPSLIAITQAQLASSDPLVRLGAAQAAGRAPFPQRLALLSGLVRDPSHAVRREVTGLLTAADRTALEHDARTALETALANHRAWLEADADRAEALVGIAALHEASSDAAAARAAYEEALQRDETSLVTLLNYADFSRAQGDDVTSDRLLTRAVALYPDSAAVRFALGLLRVRQRRHAEAVPELARAVQLAPDDSGYAYVHAVALYSTGRTGAALSALDEARRRFPANEQVRSTLDAYCREMARRDGVCAPTAAP